LTRGAVRLAVWWIIGAAVAAAVLVLLDGVFLGDPLFGIRISSWQRLFEYNLRPEINQPTSDTWLGLMLGQSAPSFVLYLLAGPSWLMRKRDARLVVLYSFPLVFLLMLAMLRSSVAMDVTARYTLPLLPLQCFLAALAFWSAASYARWPRMAARATLVLIIAAGAVPAWSVGVSLLERRTRHEGERRFAGFYEVARSVQVGPDATIFVSPRLYDGAIRPRALISLTRMNFNLPLPRKQIVTEGSWKDADYAVLSRAQYDRSTRRTGAPDPRHVVTSSDGKVVLLCLAAPCVPPL
jgi:hypothetical protein